MVIYMKKKYNIGAFYVMLSSVLFGLMPYFAKTLYSTGATPQAVLAYRFFLGALLALGWIRCKKIDLRIDRSSLIRIFIIALVGMCLTTSMLFMSFQYVSSGLAMALHFAYPAFTVLISVMLFRLKFTLRKAASVALSMIGIVLISELSFESNSLKGMALAILSAVTYAIYIISITHHKLRNLETSIINFYMFGFSSIILSLWAYFDGGFFTPSSGEEYFALGGLAFVSTFIAIMLFAKGAQLIGASDASLLSTMEPITSIILGVIFFGELLKPVHLIGVVLIILSIILVAKAKKVAE
ncbi:DMT multidrug transporter (plasmid) [Aureibacter tunicatorum]|nr:DMT multidrug transporter [Aureibacter tunicatorum]